MQRSIIMLLIVAAGVLLILRFVSTRSAPVIESEAPKAPPASTSPAPASGPRSPIAIIHTTAGGLKCELFADKAPKTVANFIGLATGEREWNNPATGKVERRLPLYNGVIFHRVIPEFMIQGGDPLGTGAGGPGYTFADELRADLLFDRPGRLAMANAGPNTNGSQFFITEQARPDLNPCLDEGGCRRGFQIVPKGTGYTIFGQCDEHAVALVKKIARMPRDERDRPRAPVKITHVEIVKPTKPA